MSFTDSRGREHKLIIARESVVVRDDALDFDRQIIAGQHVPPELLEAYEKATGDTRSREGTEGVDPKAGEPKSRRRSSSSSSDSAE